MLPWKREGETGRVEGKVGRKERGRQTETETAWKRERETDKRDKKWDEERIREKMNAYPKKVINQINK